MTKQKWMNKIFPIALAGVGVGILTCICLYAWAIIEIIKVFMP